MKTERNENNKIEQLIEKLNELEIDQQEIGKEIYKAKEEIENIKRSIEKEKQEKNTQHKHLEYERANTFEIGDEVTIRNAKQRSDNKGIVTGFTHTGYVRVKTHKGTKTRRIPSNLLITKKAT